MPMSEILAVYGAALSTLLAVGKGIDWWRASQPHLQAFVGRPRAEMYPSTPEMSASTPVVMRNASEAPLVLSHIRPAVLEAPGWIARLPLAMIPDRWVRADTVLDINLDWRTLAQHAEVDLRLVLTKEHFDALAKRRLIFQVTHSLRRDRWDQVRARRLVR